MRLAAFAVLLLLASACLGPKAPAPSSSTAPTEATPIAAKAAWDSAREKAQAWDAQAGFVGIVAIEGAPGSAFYEQASRDSEHWPLPVVADPVLGDGLLPVWFFMFRSGSSYLLVGVYGEGTVRETHEVEDPSTQEINVDEWTVDSTTAAQKANTSASWRTALQQHRASVLVGLGGEDDDGNATRPIGTPVWVLTVGDERGAPVRVMSIDARNGEIIDERARPG